MYFEKQRPYVMLVNPTLNLEFQFLQETFRNILKGECQSLKLLLYTRILYLKNQSGRVLWELLPPIPPTCYGFYISLFCARQRQHPKVGRTQGCGSGQGWENKGRQEIMISSQTVCWTQTVTKD
jgi:hypothetical protein